jgi:hypothetical protein
MSLGIQLRGVRTDANAGARVAPAAWLNSIAAWASERCEDCLESVPAVWEFENGRGISIELHPCAEALSITSGPEDEALLTANTSSAGPGYHQYVCTLIDELVDRFGIEWVPADDAEGDETGYLDKRDRDDLEEQMFRWLGAVAEQLTTHEMTGDSIAVSMSMDHQFDAGPAIVTPLGPRSREWAEATASDPASGAGFFAWWDEGETGRARRDRALARMWATIRWAPPRTEDEARAVAMTLRDLNMALEMDPSLDLPWREWLELAALVDEEPRARRLLEDRAAAATGPLVGYRRRPVRVLLPGGWNIRIPGSFSETFEDEGAFLAWDETRNIRVSSFSLSRDHDGHTHDLPTPEQLLEDDPDADLPPAVEDLGRWAEDDLIGAGKIFRDEEEGEAYWVLMGKVAGEGKLALCTACYSDQADRAWAIETWRSLR